jgi:hypothetical protein
MKARIILRSMELLCSPKRQCPSCGFSEFLSCFEFLEALQFLVNALDGSDENLFALNCMLRRSGEAPAPRLSSSLRFALSLSRECALLVMKIPKPQAKALKPAARHFSDSGMMGIANDFLLFVPQNAEFKLAGSRHRILLVQGKTITSACGPAYITGKNRSGYGMVFRTIQTSNPRQ